MTAAGERLRRGAPGHQLEAIADAPLDSGAIVGRRGWDLAAPSGVRRRRLGRVVVRSEEVNRVELRLGPAEHYSGHLRTSDGLSPLPIGSHLDRDDGRVHVGAWRRVCGGLRSGVRPLGRCRSGGAARSADHPRAEGQPSGRPAGRDRCAAVTARRRAAVPPWWLGGDLSAASGTGIATLHAWAYPLTGGPPVFLGATNYGGARPDVAACARRSVRGVGLRAQRARSHAGNYDLAVFAWSMERAGFVPPRTVRVTVRP